MPNICQKCNSNFTVTKLADYTFTIKKKKITVKGLMRLCATCGTKIDDERLESDAKKHALEEYSYKYGVSSNDIKRFREQIGISQETLSKILGCARKTITRYEAGDSLPTDTHYTLLKSVIDKPTLIHDFARVNLDKLTTREQRIIAENDEIYNISMKRIDESSPTGNKKSSDRDKRFVNAILFFSSNSILEVSLGKALYYLDHFFQKLSDQTFTGLSYARKDYGPLPQKFDKILVDLENNGFIRMTVEHQVNGVSRKHIHAIHDFDDSLFEEDEVFILNKVKNFVLK